MPESSMIVERADLAGAQLSVPRPGRASGWRTGVVALVTWLMVGWAVWAGQRPSDVAPPPSVPAEVEVDAGPGLHAAYVARRAHHLSLLLPQAFPPSAAAAQDPAGIWRAFPMGEGERALVAQIRRDATVHDPVWVLRDPIIGLPRALRISDADMRVALRGWDPGSLPPLVDRSDTPLESLVADSSVQLRGAGRPALFAAPEGDHVVDRAVRDVLHYAELRHAATERARASLLAQRRSERVSSSSALAVARARRGIRRRTGLGIWAVSGGLALLAGWGLTRRRLRVAITPHQLTLGQRQILWEDVADLWWHPDEVGLRRTDGRYHVVKGLSLQPGEVRALERQCWPLWAREHAERDVDAEQAVRTLGSAAPEV